ncbi:RNA polymerase sigma factor [Kangiella sediminilitoris]|uniref:RNA polymerase, sigma-24 subunit, ECF subfamily n=1 Tax=Kangiella sediminilitoris TaxID=1144748 RepID=A0A1B3B7K1_9GAMM|nr:RNA polymerase sigma factor [Kangiella sediminilitoris]AOE48758.1 RNA polymerase, sigma-24 subunit, ECF subfamily [Kangiella sediminilitoris]
MTRQLQLSKELRELIPVIRRFAFSLTGSDFDADDLMQNTLERLLDKGVPDDANLTKWSFRVCRNLWIDEYRSRKVRQNATENPELQESVIDGNKIIANQITLNQVQQAMNHLPEEQRSILSLVVVEGLSYQEVSDTLNIPLGTVMSRLSRARSAMVEWFNDHDMRILA